MPAQPSRTFGFYLAQRLEVASDRQARLLFAGQGPLTGALCMRQARRKYIQSTIRGSCRRLPRVPLVAVELQHLINGFVKEQPRHSHGRLLHVLHGHDTVAHEVAQAAHGVLLRQPHDLVHQLFGCILRTSHGDQRVGDDSAASEDLQRLPYTQLHLGCEPPLWNDDEKADNAVPRVSEGLKKFGPSDVGGLVRVSQAGRVHHAPPAASKRVVSYSNGAGDRRNGRCRLEAALRTAKGISSGALASTSKTNQHKHFPGTFDSVGVVLEQLRLRVGCRGLRLRLCRCGLAGHLVQVFCQ
mmetsp:Transcript_31663/g.80349  ORF Transcript_31663/g.80349 Transcript_31663/m.80349 type:complete len:298 (+) Transcript_31663:265-1158(+)